MNFSRLPQKRTRPKMGVKMATVIRCGAHLRFIRSLECSIVGRLAHLCTMNERGQAVIEAAHVRTGTDGGVSMKPSDCWTIPLCSAAHQEQHRIGEEAFQKRYAPLDMKDLARRLWDSSPPGTAYRMSHPTEDRA